MNDSTPLSTAMAEQCKSLINDCGVAVSELPPALRLPHLLWMSERIIEHAGNWPDARLQRWIGFIQCGMIANEMIDVEAAKTMFDAAKNAYAGSVPDDGLVDHLNPDNVFRFEVGGESGIYRTSGPSRHRWRRMDWSSTSPGRD